MILGWISYQPVKIAMKVNELVSGFPDFDISLSMILVTLL